MVEQDHVIRLLTVSVAFAEEHGARMMRSRVDAFWRDTAPPLMAKLFDEVVPADRHVRLPRLDLDLGRLPAQGFEAAAEAVLANALREALPQAIAASGENRSLSGDEASLEILEHFLAQGTTPFWARMAALNPPTAIAAAAARQPAQLVALLRRVAGNRSALERLVLHLGEDDLRALIGLLAPADAALVAAYLAEIVAAHRVEPLVPIEEPALRRDMWVLTLEYLLRDAGTGFNRRSFLAALLHGLADREDADYRQLLLLLRDTLERLGRRTQIHSSLPATLQELLDEAGLSAEGEPRPGMTTSVSAAGDARAFAAVTDALQDWHRRSHVLPFSEAEIRRRLEAAIRDTIGRPLALRDRLALLLRSFAALQGIAVSDLFAVLSVEAPAIASMIGLTAGELEPDGEGKNASAAGPLGELREALHRGRGDRARLALLIGLVADENPAALAAAMRQLSRQFGNLFRAVILLDEDSLERLLRVLDTEHAGEVVSYLQTLHAAHRAEPLLPIGEERFAHITWTLALDYAAREPGSQYNRRSLLRSLIAGIARHDGMEERDILLALLRGLEMLSARRTPTGSMPAILAELVAENAAQPRVARNDRWTTDSLQQAAFFLRTGRPEDGGAGLARLAARDPAEFAALLRTLAKEDPAAWETRLERLLQWLTPWEIAGFFPADQADLAHIAEAASWRTVLTDLVHGRPLTPVPVAQQRPLDAEALLTFWLEYGALPGWAPPELTLDALAAMLAAAGAPLLRSIFLAPGEAQRIAMFQRAADLLGETRLHALVAKLIPSAQAEMLAQSLSTADPEARLTILVRAAAAGIAGEPIAFAAAPEIWQAISQPALPVDKTFLLAWLAGEQEASAGQAEAIAALFAELAGKDDAEMLAVIRSTARNTALRRRWLAVLPGRHLARLIDAEPAGRATLLAWLRGEMDTPENSHALSAGFIALADDGDIALRDVLRAAWRDPEVQRRWLTHLSPRALARILDIVAPAQARFLLEAAQMLTAAWQQISPHASRELPWRAMFALLARNDGRDMRRLVQGLVTAMAGSDPKARIGLLTRAHALVREAGAIHLAAVLQPPRPKSCPRPAAKRNPGMREDKPEEPIYIRNAGLVLFAPFLPRLFERLDVLRDGPDGKPRISGIEAATRAVHLLQYLVDQRLDTPEPELVLNKLMAGLDLTLPVAPFYDASEEERDVCDSLVAATIANWPIIKGTSPAGLRETFLQREGKAGREGNAWKLRVQRKTVDVLVDQIPWSFALLLHRWMEHPIHVAW